MKCGNCRGAHDTVQEVRQCYSGVDLPQADSAVGQPGGIFGQEITDRQLSFLNTLRKERMLEPYPDGTDPKRPRVLLNRREASDEIDKLLHTPKRQAAETVDKFSRDTDSDIPEGRYAVPSLTGHNDLDFYKVDRPTDGKWAGRVFVKMVIGGKPDAPVRGARMQKVLKAIEGFGAERAGMLFGQKIGQCFKCGHTLTDKVSRDSGAGPDCRAKYGIPTVILTDGEDFSISKLPTVAKPKATTGPKKSTAAIRRKFRPVRV